MSSSTSLLHPIKVATHSIYSQRLPILLHTSSNSGRRVKHYCSERGAIVLAPATYIASPSFLRGGNSPPQGGSRPSLRGKVLALSKIIATFAEQKDILLPARLKRAYSSAGLEHLPYKQGVIGSNPIGPTNESCRKSDNSFLFFLL